MCKLLGLHKTRTTSLRPQSDGMVEKFNATIENMLASFISEEDYKTIHYHQHYNY
jgi:actin-like ATPase involved in cell morphogenesis